MYVLGCDLGSTAGKAVMLEASRDNPGGARLAAWAIEPSGFSPDETTQLVMDSVCAQLEIDPTRIEASCCTGYGREHVHAISRNMSEISCHARGAFFLHSAARTIIDVGGQDVKAISLGKTGKVLDFAMNDKCAAGTGKFFEAMARTLRCTVQELGELSLVSTDPVHISSTCSVFAESEVVTHINKGCPRPEIAGGIHESIARRLVAMVNRVGLAQDVILTGGCAKNEGLRVALERMLGVKLAVLPCDPQINGALGAALFALDACCEDASDDASSADQAPHHA